MSYKLLFTETAAADLREIALGLYRLSGSKETAASYIKGIQEACCALKDFPQSGTVPRDRVLLSLGYRYVQHRDYLAFYLVDDKACVVTVMAVFNGKLDYMRHMRQYL